MSEQRLNHQNGVDLYQEVVRLRDSHARLVAESVYLSAVHGRQEMRDALKIERKESKRLRDLLAEARTRIPDWETGVNHELLTAIDAALSLSKGGG